MKNPWKRLSKINPQPEDGTRRINYKVFDALIKTKLSTAEMSVVMVIISKTWGFNKTVDAISTSQFIDATGFPGRTIKRVRKELFKKRMIYFQTSERVMRGTPLNEYSFNKHYDTWKTQDIKKGVTHDTGVIRGKKRVSLKPPTIETITIDKELYNRVINYLNKKTGKNFKINSKVTIEKINARLNDKFKPEDFKTVIDNKVEDYKKGNFEFIYLRPETLFGKKFESYLNQKPLNKTIPKPETQEDIDKEVSEALL